MVQAGFESVEVDLNHRKYEDDLGDLARAVRLRVTSQLIVIDEGDYRAGLGRIEEELCRAGESGVSIPSEYCLMKIKGEMPV